MSTRRIVYFVSLYTLARYGMRTRVHGMRSTTRAFHVTQQHSLSIRPAHPHCVAALLQKRSSTTTAHTHGHSSIDFTRGHAQAYSVWQTYTNQTQPTSWRRKMHVRNVLLATRPTDTTARTIPSVWQLTIPAKLLTAAAGLPREPPESRCSSSSR